MSKAKFFLLAALGFVVATAVIGIRGLGNWEPYELGLYYLLVIWTGYDLYRRHVQAGTS